MNKIILLVLILLFSAYDCVASENAKEVVSNNVETQTVKEKIVNELPVNKGNFEERSTIASEVAAYATVAIAILTILLALETVRLRRIQAKQVKDLNDSAIKPVIQLYLQSNAQSVNLVEIHLVNSGRGSANNLVFSFSPEQNEAFDNAKLLIEKIERIYIFKNGLRYLGAGQERKSLLFSALERKLNKNDLFFQSVINVDVSCEDDLGKTYQYQYTFDISELLGLRNVSNNTQKEISDNIEKIQKHFSNIVKLTHSGHRLQVDHYDDLSRIKEYQEVLELLNKEK